MPISLSSILFENDPVTNAQDNNQSSATGQAEAPTKEDIRALAQQRYHEAMGVKAEPITSSDIDRNVDTIIAVATGKEHSNDPEDLEFDRQSGNAVTTKQQSPELPDLSSLLDTETEVESLNEGKMTIDDNEGEMTIDDEVEQILKSYNNKDLQRSLFDEIFGGADPVFEEMKGKSGFFRVKAIKDPKKDLSDPSVIDDLDRKIKTKQKQILGNRNYKVVIIKKKQPGSGSGIFDTWSIIDNIEDKSISVVFANGGNKGHEFETKVGAEFDKKLGPAWEALRNYLLIPSNDPAGVGVDLTTDLKSFVLTNQNTTKVRRPFTVKISDVGAVISDLTLKIKNRKTPIYVSLKGEKGKTIANNGYPGFKVDEDTGVVTAPSLNNMVGVDSDLLNFVKAVGLNNSLIAKGLTSWINSGFPQTPQIKVEINPAQGTEALKYVTAQIGYGYIYFREKSGGSGFTIMTLKNAGDIGKLVGNFTGGEIRYPYYMQNNSREEDKSSRQCTIRLNTDKANYNVEIRKTSSVSDRRTDAAMGLQCNMQITKIHDTPTASLVEARTRTSFNGTTSQKAPVLLSSLLWPQRLHQ